VHLHEVEEHQKAAVDAALLLVALHVYVYEMDMRSTVSQISTACIQELVEPPPLANRLLMAAETGGVCVIHLTVIVQSCPSPAGSLTRVRFVE